MRESNISRERALAILTATGHGDEYDPWTDYWVVTEGDGSESLWRGGDDGPFATNNTSTSWLGS